MHIRVFVACIVALCGPMIVNYKSTDPNVKLSIMEPTKQDITAGARVGYEWNPDFATPQTKSRPGQNMPFWAQGDHDIEAPCDTNEILSLFLGEVFDDAGPVLYQAVPIREFCLPADISILGVGNDLRIQRHLALLDERNDDGLRRNPRGTVRRSIHDGALTANDLYKALRKKVCPSECHSLRKVLQNNNDPAEIQRALLCRRCSHRFQQPG